ncbi:MAG TPA: hypothetical protein VF440_11705 [Novosphingobium sp.]
MSDKLAISAALSVLMMAAYVLLGADALHAPPAPVGLTEIEASAPALPTLELGDLLPKLR